MGRASVIMDSLVAAKKAKPMLVVMTNGNANQKMGPGYGIVPGQVTRNTGNPGEVGVVGAFAADRALALYGLNGGPEPQPDPLLGTVMAQWATDSQFRCGTVAELLWHTGAGNPGYQFQFARATPGREAAGAAHGSEVAYVFGNLGRAANSPKYDATDQQVSAAMQTYWTNFAKTGDPNGAGLPRWPKFDPAGRAYLEFTDAGPVVREGLRRQVCDLYTENLKRQMAK